MRDYFTTKCGLFHTGCGLLLTACGLFHIGCGLFHTACGLFHIGCGLFHTACGFSSHRMWMISHRMWVISYRMWVISHRMWVISHGMWMISHRMWVISYRMWVIHTGCGLVLTVVCVNYRRLGICWGAWWKRTRSTESPQKKHFGIRSLLQMFDHLLNIQGTFSAHSGNVQCTFRERSVSLPLVSKSLSRYGNGLSCK